MFARSNRVAAVSPRPFRRGRSALGALVASISVMAAALAGLVATSSGAAAAPAVLDGSLSSLAAASCWQIKQQAPANPDGVYWLQTAQLIAPRQFYCDMTTDGGGWVLVGRGRDGWAWADGGQGSLTALRNTPTGTGAFAPATLSSSTIEGLLGGSRVDALTDGIRVRRAKDIAGTSYQEMRIKTSNRPGWTWAIGGGVNFSSLSADGVSYSGGNTQSWASTGSQQGFLRLTTKELVAHNYRMGWSFGNTIAGQNNATSYLWQYASEKSALPFTQVFLRPNLTSSSYSAIPAGGLPASTVRPMVSSTTSPNTPWGVTGILGAASELNMEVETFAQIGNVMYVGGGFQYVQKGANPAPGEKIAQPWLAGFDVNTGEWLSSFRPALNAMVWDLQATPDGKLVVGGEFTTVNGVNATGLAELDPITGATVAGWSASVADSSGVAQVKAIDYQDGWLYIGGRFTQVTGGTPAKGPVTVGRAARLRVSDGQPDGTWKPHFDGSVIELDASAQGDRVYFAGYFNNVNNVSSKNIGIVTTAAGAASIPGLAAWQPSIGSNNTYQQAIKEGANVVWQGGSEHNLHKYNRQTYELESASITKQGGDTQTIAITDGIVYASCHCGNYTYSGSNNYSNPIPGASDVNNIKYIGAWDEQSGENLTEFYPSGLDTRSGIGGWELTPDTNKCLWFGGDFKQGSYQANGYQWLGGFGKFCQRDSIAPGTPANLKSSTAATGIKLSWSAASDNSGSVNYEVLRDDRVIATTSGLSYIDTTGSAPADYWVRAIDSMDNRSATSAKVTVQAADTTAPTATLTSPDDGASVYGPVTVTATADDDRGVTSVDLLVDGQVIGSDSSAPYSFSWSATAVGEHTLKVVAHDAAGNMGTSPTVSVTVPADTTAPTASITSPDNGASVYGPVTVTATADDDRAVTSVDLQVDGQVVDSDSTAPYSFNWSATAAGEHALKVVAHDAAGNAGTSPTVTVTVPADTTDPGAPGSLTSTGVTTSAASLAWTAATDDRGVTGYRVLRDGTQVGQTSGALTFTDTGLTAGTTYSYTVRAVDAAGNVGAATDALSVTTDSEASALFSENWSGTDGAPWSSAWVTGTGTGTADIQSNAGRLAVDDTANAYARAQLTGLAVRSDSELLTSYRWSSNTTLSYLSVYLRGSGGWQNSYRPKNGYGLQLQSNSATATVQKNVASVTSTVQSVTGAQAVTTGKQWLRLRVSGSTIQFKIWADGSSEPTAWKATNTDTSVTAPGQLFLSTVRGGTNVGAKSVTFDDLTVTATP